MKDFIFGIRAIIETIDSGKEIEKVLFKKGLQGELYQELFSLVRQRNIPFQYVPIQKIDRITKKNHQGVLAFISPVAYHDIEQVVPAIFENGKLPLILVLDSVTDVRNFGAIARTAECAGIDTIVVPTKGGAMLNADAVKTSAGALNRIPICRTNSLKKAVEFLQESGIQVVCASEKASEDYFKVDFSAPTAIVMGGEEAGISPDILRFADKLVRIPMSGKTASLNVSVASGIVIYEAVRQRFNNK